MPDLHRLDTTACRQYGLVTTQQLLSCGFTKSMISRMVRAARVHRVRYGVYQLAGVPPTWRSRALAGVLSIGGQAVLSHESAAALWGLRSHRGLATIHITGRQAQQRGVRVHRRHLTAQDRTVHAGIPVTTAARTIVDLSDTYRRPRLGERLDEALRLGITTLPQVEAALSRANGRRLETGHQTLRGLLFDRGVDYDPGDSVRERHADDLWDEWGLPPSRRQYWVRGDGWRYRLDRAIVELKIGIEWNGRDRHDLRSRFEYDMDRRNRLQAAGWRILDFHYRNERGLIVNTVLAVCEERRRQFGRPEPAA